MTKESILMTLTCFDKDGNVIPNYSTVTKKLKDILVLPYDIEPGNNYFPEGTVRAELSTPSKVLEDILGAVNIDFIIGEEYPIDVDELYIRHYHTSSEASFAIIYVATELEKLINSTHNFVDSVSYDSFHI